MSNAGNVNVQIGATFASTFKAAFGQAEGQITRLGGTVRDLDGKLQRVQGFQRMRDSAYQTETAWRKADAELREMSQHLSGLGAVTDKQAKEFRALERRTESMRVAMERARTDTDKMERELREAGQSTQNLTGQQRDLERQLTATTNRMTAMAGLANSGVGTALQGVGSEFRSLATQATIAGAGLGYFFKRNFIDTASMFERMRIQLNAIEGSSDKAQVAMDWIKEFAKDTPLELADTTKAFVQMRAFGMDPMNGSLQAIVDQVSKLGGGAAEVEAIILQLGQAFVKGKLQGDDLKSLLQRGVPVFDMLAKRMGKTTEEIQGMITAGQIGREEIGLLIDEMGRSSAGASANMAKTWEGLISKAGDMWTGFANDVMGGGLFDWMKGQLEAVFARLEAWEESGQLQAWAVQTGAAIKEFLVGAWELGTAFVDLARGVADFVGGWKNLGMIMLGLKLAPLIFSIGKLGWALGGATTYLLMFATGTATAGAAWASFGLGIVKFGGMALTAFKTLAAFMLTNPIGLALTALAVAGYLLWDNWEAVKTGLAGVWTVIKDTAIAAFEALKGYVGQVIDWLASKTAWIFSTIDKVRGAAGSIGDGIGGAWGGLKTFAGFGDEPQPNGAPAGAGGQVVGEQTGTAPQAVHPVVPTVAASRPGTVSNVSTIHAPITITGVSDPAESARLVRIELARAQREAEANQRSRMTDPIGH